GRQGGGEGPSYAEKGVPTLKRLIQFSFLFAVLACIAAGSASALTFQDRTCDNSKPTCPMPPGQADVSYGWDMFARSGCPPYHYNITGGTPPPGLVLSSVNAGATGGIGRWSGTPTTPGNYSFWVTITTPESPTCLGDRADRLFTITIGNAPLSIKTASLRRGITGQAYTETLVAGGGGNQWSATGLPPGLTLSGNSITGTPTTEGAYAVKVTAADPTVGLTQDLSLSLKVAEHISIATLNLKAATVGKPFLQRLRVFGGIGPFTWRSLGPLPAGLKLNKKTG